MKQEHLFRLKKKNQIVLCFQMGMQAEEIQSKMLLYFQLDMAKKFLCVECRAGGVEFPLQGSCANLVEQWVTSVP